MGVLRNGANGGFSGKVGSIIGYHLNGQDIIRGWPKKRTKKAGTAEQQNRDKFALSQTWLKPLLHFLRIGFKNYAPTFQGFVAAKSYNSRNAMQQNEDGSWQVDPSRVLISYGRLPLPQQMEMELVKNEIVITWEDDKYSGYEYAMALAHDPKDKKVTGDVSVAKRKSGKAVIPAPHFELGKTFHVYLAFVSYDQTERSNSHYLGPITY